MKRGEKRREGTGGKLGEEETVGRIPKSSQVASILRASCPKEEEMPLTQHLSCTKALFYTSHRPSCFTRVVSAGSASAPPNMPLPVAHISYCIYSS